MTASTQLDAQISEADWQSTVVDLAHALGWIVAHFRPARTKDGWRTAVAYDGRGFPDIVAARDGRVVFLELKTARGRVTPHQQAWLDILPAAHVIRPGDWQRLQEILR